MKKSSLLLSSFCVLQLLVMNNLWAGSWDHETYFGLSGIRNYHVYVPSTLSDARKAPVVVMLHGCDQTPADFAKGTRIEKWADKEKFIAVLPEQNPMYNPFKCWNWYAPINNTRIGEPLDIVGMLDDVLSKYDADESNVYAAGMSAGASMVSTLGNCFPERFKALAAHDGTQYYATATGLDFVTVVLYGASVFPEFAAATGVACSSMVVDRPAQMPIIILKGMNSPLMSPLHALQVEHEFKAFNDYLDNGVRDNSYLGSENVQTIPESKSYGYDLYTTKNSDNDLLIERYMIDKLGHEWSGGVAGKYNNPNGPDASALIMKFFKHYGL